VRVSQRLGFSETSALRGIPALGREWRPPLSAGAPRERADLTGMAHFRQRSFMYDWGRRRATGRR